LQEKLIEETSDLKKKSIRGQGMPSIYSMACHKILCENAGCSEFKTLSHSWKVLPVAQKLNARFLLFIVLKKCCHSRNKLNIEQQIPFVSSGFLFLLGSK
jgi:hypothetical protein